MTAPRRTYYDHEAAYQRIAATGGTGWDDLFQGEQDSYLALDGFLASSFAPPHARVIDLGCGGGQATRKLAARGYAVIGIDFAATAIELARANVIDDRVQFVVGDCLELAAFDDGAFDLAIDNHVLHCLLGADRGRFLREVARVLRPGGLLFSETMSREAELDLDALNIDPDTFISRHGNRYWTTRAELDRDFDGAGFEVLERGARGNAPGEGRDLITYARRRP